MSHNNVIYKQICKRNGRQWELTGFVDMGSHIDNLEYLITRRQEKKLATHVLQFTFTGYGGFRWLVAYFGSSTATAYQINTLFWEAVDVLGQYGFIVDYCTLDGATTNRAFMKMLLSREQIASNDFTATDIYNPCHKIIIMQDVKHVLKKIRNSIYSSRIANVNKTEISSRYILLDNQPMFSKHAIHTTRNSAYDCITNSRVKQYSLVPPVRCEMVSQKMCLIGIC